MARRLISTKETQMRTARKLFLLALTALAALAFASPANAVTVTDEGTTDPCGAVTLTGHAVSGGCVVRVAGEGETQLIAGTAGGPMVISQCEDIFEAHIDSAGEGYIDNVTLDNHPTANPQCTRTPCDETTGTDIPWRIHIRSAPSRAHVVFCLRNASLPNGSGGTTCEVNIPFSQAGHEQEFNAEGSVPCLNLPAGAVSVRGHWHARPDANHPAVEFAGL
jgi:hypothetical protein